METTVIQRQYDDVIAQHYDQDPQDVTGDSQSIAFNHLREHGPLQSGRHAAELRVLDLGMGTGLFLDRIIQNSNWPIEPWGVDLSSGMAAIAQEKIPSLNYEVGDAADFDSYFIGETFHVICTHFITGFVPAEHLAPLIANRLEPGGVWSFVGSSKIAYPELRRRASTPMIRSLFGGDGIDTSELLCPNDADALQDIFTAAGLETVTMETFEPRLEFADFDAFMEFAYHGGWLTPFVEELGLQDAGKTIQWLLNKLVFPIQDNHNVIIGLGKKPEK